MRLCWNLLLAASVVFAVISDAAALKDEETKKPPKLGKKCVFNKQKFKKGTTIETVQKACVELKCVEDPETNKAVMELQSIENCVCKVERRRRSIIEVEGLDSYIPMPAARGNRGRLAANADNDTKAAEKRPPKKTPKCAFNDKKYSYKSVVINKPNNCVKLECKKDGRKGFLKFNYDTSDCTCGAGDEEYKWCYHGTCGPDTWPANFDACGASRQSPIDIVTSDVLTDFILTDIQFTNYESEIKWKILNNGYSAKVSAYPEDHRGIIINPTTAPTAPAAPHGMPFISGGGLDGEYEFLQFHYHWGSVNTRGSEHTIDGKEYPLELHFVHWKRSYELVATALGQPDGLAVLGVLFETGDNVADNPAFADVIAALSEIPETANEYTLPVKQALAPLLPASTSEYYRYLGSLTTPTCNEAVIWTVFKDTVQISPAQLAAFRLLLDAGGDPIVDNFRPPQPLNGRTVMKKA